MLTYPIKAIHNLSRPGHPPDAGDVVTIETPTGFIREVDPETRQCRDVPKPFVVTAGGGPVPAKGC